VWKELAQKFPKVFNQCVEQTEQITQDRLWNKRPDGIAFKVPTKDGAGVICLLQFNRMSDITSHYIVRTERVAETQYVSLKSALVITMQHQGWKVEQVSFIAGARSLNEEEFKKNLAYFKVPSTSVEPIRVKLSMTIFDGYTNILKGMYSILFNSRPDYVNEGG
jgi:hypothetical protein